MNGRTRTLLAIAMSTALIAPIAFAQAAKDMPRPTLPPEAAPRAVEATTDVTQQRPTARTADAVDARVTPAATQPTGKDQAKKEMGAKTTTDAMTSKEIPPTAQGDAHAAAHSSVVQREAWERLDTDTDGLISATEADADVTFDGDFDAMDADDDGFISDTEYRTFAKAAVSQGATNAASHSSVVQRATWSRLDADSDGRISPTEADADAGIDGSFSVIDGNSDGFITDAEFRAHAKTTSTP